MDKPYIPYNLKLKQKARELRKNQTKEEIVFYNQILKKHFKEYRFLKQKPIDGFILDFYCSKLNLGIEIDGGIHIAQKIRDKERDEILLNKHNIQVIRFSNKDVTHNVQNVVDVIKQCIKSP
jgi:very-short-patch-repair endonuclease